MEVKTGGILNALVPGSFVSNSTRFGRQLFSKIALNGNFFPCLKMAEGQIHTENVERLSVGNWLSQTVNKLQLSNCFHRFI